MFSGTVLSSSYAGGGVGDEKNYWMMDEVDACWLSMRSWKSWRVRCVLSVFYRDSRVLRCYVEFRMLIVVYQRFRHVIPTVFGCSFVGFIVVGLKFSLDQL